jgi:hypothetical protein
MTVDERFDDIAARYAGRANHLGTPTKVEEKRMLCLKLEKQLEKKLKIRLDTLNDQILLPYVEQVKDNNI